MVGEIPCSPKVANDAPLSLVSVALLGGRTEYYRPDERGPGCW